MTILDEYDLRAIRRVIAILQDDADFLDREHNRPASEMRQHVLAVVSRLKKRHTDAMKQARPRGDGCAYSEPVPAIPPACCESCTGDDADEDVPHECQCGRQPVYANTVTIPPARAGEPPADFMYDRNGTPPEHGDPRPYDTRA